MFSCRDENHLQSDRQPDVVNPRTSPDARFLPWDVLSDVKAALGCCLFVGQLCPQFRPLSAERFGRWLGRWNAFCCGCGFLCHEKVSLYLSGLFGFTIDVMLGHQFRCFWLNRSINYCLIHLQKNDPATSINSHSFSNHKWAIFYWEASVRSLCSSFLKRIFWAKINNMFLKLK